jgi:hypothetical protein
MRSIFSGVPIPVEKFPILYGGQMGVPGSDTIEGQRLGSTSIVYYVDKYNPNANDNNDGTDPRFPKATIASAIAANNATINWADAYGGTKPYNWIKVGVGVYAEALTSLPHYCHVLGTGVIGTDGATEIHPTAGSAIAGTQINGRWANIWFETETAVPVMDFDICNNVMIEDCAIVMGIAGLATMGIQTNNASHMQIYNNFFCSGVANLPIGIQFLGGANKYAHCVRIVDNTIYAATTGIDIPANCTASGALIQRNVIAGRPVTGIQDLNGGSTCVDNWITASVDAINHANLATNCIANHVIDAAVGAVEAAGTD